MGAIVVIIFSLAVLCIGGYHINAAPPYEKVLSEWGQYLSEHDYSTEVYVRGENIYLTSSDVEQAVMFYTLNGMTEKAALQKAILYMAEREVLYQKAVEAGYTVTDEEIREYLEELKANMDSADNREDAMRIMEQFASEEAYWEYEFAVCQKNLLVQNYVADLEKQFMMENGNSEAWPEYFEEYKKKLIKAERLRIVR